jgi:uncharacterized membrane protein
MKKVFAIVFLFFAFSGCTHAQQNNNADTLSMVKAQVIKVEKQGVQNVTGTSVNTIEQTLQVKILDGDQTGNIVTIDNDYTTLTEGEVFYMQITKSSYDGSLSYAVSEPYRMPVIYFFIGLFILLVVIFGGIQGIRGLFSLAGSLVLIFYVLIPSILNGYPSIWVGLGIAGIIITLGSYITHGFRKTTSAAIVGMAITIVITSILAFFAVHAAHFTGFSTEDTVYLNMDTAGSINFLNLLLAGIIIGLLGILYDVAISQAVSVEELHTVAPHLSRREIYNRAIRIGREHIGALVNILAIAYVGASLPIILLYVQSAQFSNMVLVNKELFSTEIIRTMVGSIGLIIAVPITTAIAVYILIQPQKKSISKNVERGEKKEIQDIH